jgi:hypothetical protein
MTARKISIPDESEFFKTFEKYRTDPIILRFLSTKRDTYDISEKRSERTTFNLSSEAALALQHLTKNSGVNFKDVFDHMIRRFVRLLREIVGNDNDKKILYESLTEHTEHEVRKTFVISKYARMTLNILSKHLKFPRNTLIDFIIREFYYHFIKIQETKAKKLKEFVDKLADGRDRLYQTITDMQDYAEDDRMFKGLITAYYNLEDEISALRQEIENYQIQKKE